jgi:hypothetical protein
MRKVFAIARERSGLFRALSPGGTDQACSSRHFASYVYKIACSGPRRMSVECLDNAIAAIA